LSSFDKIESNKSLGFYLFELVACGGGARPVPINQRYVDALVFSVKTPQTDDMNAPQEAGDFWRRCSSCKSSIAFGAKYWVCNVSTCNRKRTGLIFCNVSCWDAHVPMMNHRESWAEERRAPSRAEWEKILSGEGEKTERKRSPSAADASAKKEEPLAQAVPAKVILRRAR